MELMNNDDNPESRSSGELTGLHQQAAEREAIPGQRNDTVTALQADLEKLKNVLKEMMITLASTADTKDPYKADHQRRVARLSCAIAGEMGFSGERIDTIEFAGTVHDIGKISVPTQVLTKTSRLLKSEYTLLKNHPVIGCELLEKAGYSEPLTTIVLQHHERMNGSGYPQGLSGEDILIEARILAIADVVEALSSQRSHRQALGIEMALREIKNHRERLYDADGVDACVHVITKGGFSWDE